MPDRVCTPEPRKTAGNRDERQHVRRTALAAVFALSLLYLGAAAWIGVQGESIVGHFGFLAAVTILFLTMLAMQRLRPTGRVLIWVLVVGLAARLCFVPFPASDDVNRYLWEGRVQSHGVDPFVTPPSAPELRPLRDNLWQGINHKELPTIYWPAAQLLFAAAARIAYSPLVFKSLFLLFDIAAAVLLLGLLRARGKPDHRVLLYWLNPLVLVFTAGEAHLEIVPVALIVGSLLACEHRKHRLMFLLAGLAAMVKLTAVPVVPFLIRRRTAAHAWWAAVPALLFLLYPSGAPHAFDVPLRFLRGFTYNGLTYTVLRQTLGGGAAVTSAAILVIVLTVVFFFTPDPIRAVRNALAALLLCATTVHPWYFQLITPFLALFVSPAWLVLHLTALPLTFFFYNQASAPFWHSAHLLFTVEYLPFLIAAAAAFAWRTFGKSPPGSRPPPRISVVIPVLNEVGHIGRCVESIRTQSVPAEIVVADGGSTDGTVEAVAGMDNVELVHAAKGRGPQIRSGVQHCTGDIVVVVHGDSQLLPGAFTRLVGRLTRQPSLVGGAFGAHYDNPAVRFRLTELLNNLRAIVLGVSFGDQCQFFRREQLAGHLPAYVLMEDVELSFRMQERGDIGFVPHGVRTSTRRWQRTGYAGNFMKVVALTGLFVVLRRFGLLSKDGHEFYRWYYGR
ncbi:MAG: glycosyltransferase [Chitinivibrionales bacterium]|nr:glycosyltransferase [Chitinivibrionales bacterium]